MKLSISIFASIAFVAFVAFQSCKKENNEPETENETTENTVKISTQGSNKSHNMGLNCMNCHKNGGAGEGIFNVAGTVYDTLQTTTLANGIVKLYTGANATGTLRSSLQIDAKGNFYTTEAIDFTGGLYPSIQGNTSTFHMSSSITNGQCNSCHGNSTGKLYTK